jgi:hypothetical protein
MKTLTLMAASAGKRDPVSADAEERRAELLGRLFGIRTSVLFRLGARSPRRR